MTRRARWTAALILAEAIFTVAAVTYLFKRLDLGRWL